LKFRFFGSYEEIAGDDDEEDDDALSSSSSCAVGVSLDNCLYIFNVDASSSWFFGGVDEYSAPSKETSTLGAAPQGSIQHLEHQRVASPQLL